MSEIEIHREADQNQSVIDRVLAAHREELKDDGALNAEADKIAEEARELAGLVPF